MMCDVTSGDGKESDNVLAFCVDSKDKFLIAGNMKGSITVFDISKFCNGKGTQVNTQIHVHNISNLFFVCFLPFCVAWYYTDVIFFVPRMPHPLIA